MKHGETCACGATIEIHYESASRMSYENERRDALKAMDKWHRMHKGCGQRFTSAPFGIAPPSIQMPPVSA